MEFWWENSCQNPLCPSYLDQAWFQALQSYFIMANNLKKLKVTELQQILKDRGVSLAENPRKASLVELCEAALKLNIEVDPDGLLEDREHVISSKLMKENGTFLPNPGTLAKVNDISGLPLVSIIDIYNYLAQCHFYTNESLRDYKRMEGYTMAIDGCVENIETCRMVGHEGYHVMYGHVKPRTRAVDPVTKLKYYSNWVILLESKTRNTSIYSAYCVCKGGYVFSQYGSCHAKR